MKIPGKIFCGCWLTMLNDNISMPNSQIIFSRMSDQPRNLQKIPAIQFIIACFELVFHFISLDYSSGTT